MSEDILESTFEARDTCGPGSSFSAFGFLSFLMIGFNLAVNLIANVNSNSNANNNNNNNNVSFWTLQSLIDNNWQ